MLWTWEMAMKLLNMLRLRRKRYIRNESGATAVEFAMVSPLFFLMVGVTLETGLMLFTEYVLQTSVQEAARLVRTGQAQSNGYNAAQFKAKICDLAGLIINCSSKVEVYLAADNNFTGLDGTVPSVYSIGAKLDGSEGPKSFTCGGPSQAVALIATYDWDFTIPYFMGFFKNMGSADKRRLAAFAMFKNEPFPAGGGCV